MPNNSQLGRNSNHGLKKWSLSLTLTTDMTTMTDRQTTTDKGLSMTGWAGQSQCLHKSLKFKSSIESMEVPENYFAQKPPFIVYFWKPNAKSCSKVIIPSILTTIR